MHVWLCEMVLWTQAYVPQARLWDIHMDSPLFRGERFETVLLCLFGLRRDSDCSVEADISCKCCLVKGQSPAHIHPRKQHSLTSVTACLTTLVPKCGPLCACTKKAKQQPGPWKTRTSVHGAQGELTKAQRV